MAVNPLTLLDGTTAFASDVEAKFNPLYTDIAPTNVGASNKTGTGKFVLDTNPVLTSPTITGFTSAQHTHASAAQGGALDAIGRVTFDAQGCVLPTTAPSTNRSAALVSGVLQIHDGTSAKSYLRTDTYNETVWNNGGVPYDLGAVNDGAFVDIAGASIAFTVNVPGRYSVTFEFSVYLTVTAGGFASRSTDFRLTDGTTNQRVNRVQHSSDATGLSGSGVEYPLFLIGVFNFTTTGSKTVKLQKQNISTVGAGSRNIGNISNVNIAMKAFRIAD